MSLISYYTFISERIISSKSVTVCNLSVFTLLEGWLNDWDHIHVLIQNGIDIGLVLPLDVDVFGKMDIQSAFTYLQDDRCREKVLVQV